MESTESKDPWSLDGEEHGVAKPMSQDYEQERNSTRH